jgi:hypothetical protein
VQCTRQFAGFFETRSEIRINVEDKSEGCPADLDIPGEEALQKGSDDTPWPMMVLNTVLFHVPDLRSEHGRSGNGGAGKSANDAKLKLKRVAGKVACRAIGRTNPAFKERNGCDFRALGL